MENLEAEVQRRRTSSFIYAMWSLYLAWSAWLIPFLLDMLDESDADFIHLLHGLREPLRTLADLSVMFFVFLLGIAAVMLARLSGIQLRGLPTSWKIEAPRRTGLILGTIAATLAVLVAALTSLDSLLAW